MTVCVKFMMSSIYQLHKGVSPEYHDKFNISVLRNYFMLKDFTVESRLFQNNLKIFFVFL